MKSYAITATLTFESAVKIEGSMEEHVKQFLRDLVADYGVDRLLNFLEFGEVVETDVTKKEWEEMSSNEEDVRIPVEGFREYLVAVSLGLVDNPIITSERAQELLSEWETILNNQDKDKDY
jgi:hypothetical protein